MYDLRRHLFTGWQTDQAAIYTDVLMSDYRSMALTDHGLDLKVDGKGAPGREGDHMDRRVRICRRSTL